MLLKLKELILGHELPIYVISFAPYIAVVYDSDLIKFYNEIMTYLPTDRNIYFLIQLGYHVETPERMSEITNNFSRTIKENRLKLIFLANSVKEESYLRENGFIAYFCHQNAFLDESRYKVLTSHKEYDAIYLARFTPCKRHYLARKIKTMLLIGDYKEKEKKYFEDSLLELTHAKWVKKVRGISVYKYMNKARTGLCLSKEEGAMFVSAEYLLCGLPVVNTQNIGGRDHFFSDDNSITCEDNDNAVKEAVEELIRRKLDPALIRLKTIERFQVHREKFISIVQEIYGKESINKSFRDEWNDVFTHKLGLRCSSLKFLFSKRKFFKSNITKMDFESK